MTNIYLTEQGTYLRKHNDQIVYEKDGEVLLERPIKDVGMVVIFGQIQVSVQALLALLENGCDVSMMTQNGHFRGRLVPALGKNVSLRVNQYSMIQNTKYRLELSRRIVCAKIHNSYYLLKKYHYSGTNPVRFEEFEELEEMKGKAGQAETLDSLRGFEGMSAKLYFDGFGRAITGDISFPG